ncbi:MAG: nucleotide exchange factor GrpE, partial [Planctomycetia bacterium]|nr:nucleotide exchange factor GrpE [Planctomycetia bacterium]
KAKTTEKADSIETPSFSDEFNDQETIAEPSEVAAWGETLQGLMEKLLNEFKGKLKYDAKKQEQIDQLYRENLEFRDGLVEKCKKNLILAIIEQIDDAEKQITHFKSTEYSEANFKKLLASFEDIALGLRDMLLERFDVNSWQSEAETPFNPKRQRTLRTTPTDDEAKFKTVRQSIRFGYETAEGFLIRPEMVDVYVFDASRSAPREEPSQDVLPDSTNNNAFAAE